MASLPISTSTIWDRLYKLNIRSTLTACRAVLPAMRKQGNGSIVNMASISGLRGDPGWAAYNSAKSGIISLTQSLAWEEGLNGIRVNAICPGPIGSERMLATLSAEDFATITRLARSAASVRRANLRKPSCFSLQIRPPLSPAHRSSPMAA